MRPMPTLHRFGNCKLQMFAREHGVPHVHLAFPEGKAVLAIDTGELLAGKLPRHGADEARAWIAANRAMLLARWAELQGE